MSDSEKRNRFKLFLLDDEAEKENDEERTGLIHRLKNLLSREVAIVDVPAVAGANWRTIKNEAAEPSQQLELDGIKSKKETSLTNDELGELVTDLEKEQNLPESQQDEASNASEDVVDEGDKSKEIETSSFFEEAFNRLDELSTQNNELQASVSGLQSQVDRNTESLSTFSISNNEPEVGEEESQSETKSELVQDETVISMNRIMEEADILNHTATEIRELRESGQISQEQFDEKIAEVSSALESLETIAISEVA